jgi:hypothetical protein
MVDPALDRYRGARWLQGSRPDEAWLSFADRTYVRQSRSLSDHLSVSHLGCRLTGVVFADEAAALERWMLGLVPESGTEEPETALVSQSG